MLTHWMVAPKEKHPFGSSYTISSPLVGEGAAVSFIMAAARCASVRFMVLVPRAGAKAVTIERKANMHLVWKRGRHPRERGAGGLFEP